MTWMLPPALFFLLAAAMGGLALVFPEPVLLPYKWSFIGVPLALAGIAMLLWGSWTFDNANTNIKTFGAPGRLVTHGLFRWSRNPMYLGFVFLLGGAALLLRSAWALGPVAAFVVACQFWYIPFEERAMEASFGDAYREYRARTRRWL